MALTFTFVLAVCRCPYSRRWPCLALTIALSPPLAFEGGGTYFEYLNATVDMGQGHVTFRPGSVRHAGAPISSGVRYVIGAFVALEDKVEHVRRLVERGNRILMLVDAGQAGERHLRCL